MLNTLKIKLYNEICYAHDRDTQASEIDEKLTDKVLAELIQPLNLDKSAVIRDVGSGQCYFLQRMRELGYTDLTGTGVLINELRVLESKGFPFSREDCTTFEGVKDETVDLVFARQVLHHSPMPFFALIEWNHKLKLRGHAYVEVPAPGQRRQHEFAGNSYSVLGREQWFSLFNKAGFEIVQAQDFNLDVEHDETKERFQDTFYAFLLKKQRPVDSK